MNNKITSWIPLLLAFAFAGGMWLQRTFYASKQSAEYSKIDVIQSLIANNYVDEINADTLNEAMIAAILDKLDPHSSYFTKEEYLEMSDPIRGSFEGIGVQFSIQSDTVVIVQVLHGGPSEKLNILAGDRIVSVNDSVIAGNGITNDKVMKLLKGPSGTIVNVGIHRAGVPEILPFSITRGPIPITSINTSYMISSKTGYISINCFSATTHEEFLQAMEKLGSQGMENLIIDLSENGGGLLFTAIELANEFLAENDTIVFTKSKLGEAKYYTARGDGQFRQIPLAVILNEYSASASEVFAGAIQDNARGTIVGRRSFGKGVVNEDFPMADSSVMRLTVKKFYTPSGRCIQKPFNGNHSDYDDEVLNRYYHGELYTADSINFPDSLKFVTRSGKVVYGGGGIMPDVFVPLDTTKYSADLNRVLASNAIHKFAFSFSDIHRAELTKLHTISAVESFCDSQFSAKNILADSSLKQFPAKRFPQNELQIIERRVKAYVIQYSLENEAFYQYLNTDDETIKRALQLFE